MSYSNPVVELFHNGNGSDDSFDVTFTYLEGETLSIAVELWDYTNPALPVQQPFVLNVDYEIDETAYPATKVNTTVPVPSDFKLVIYRNTPKIQPVSFVNGAFPAESVEEAIDRVAFIGQENAAKLGRALIQNIAGPTITIEEIQEIINIVANSQAQIDANTSNIATNTSNIATNASNIATNASDISGLDSRVTQNESDIASLTPYTLTIVSSPGTYIPSNKEVIIVKSDNVTINLPAPSINFTVIIKMDGLRNNIVVNSAQGIDGFGANYTLLSTYESLNLVSDGTQWYII